MCGGSHVVPQDVQLSSVLSGVSQPEPVVRQWAYPGEHDVCAQEPYQHTPPPFSNEQLTPHPPQLVVSIGCSQPSLGFWLQWR